MKLLWHLFAADVRRLRVLLLLWVAVVGLGAAVDIARPYFASSVQVRDSLAVVASLLFFSRLLLAVLLVPLVIQAHAAVGTNAFWMTRPIPLAPLVIAKLLLIGLATIVIPAIAEVAVISRQRFPLGTVAGVVADGSLVVTLLILMLTVAAVWTSNLPRFLALCGAAVGLMAIALSLVIVYQTRQLASSGSVSFGVGFEPEMEPTRSFIYNLLFVFVLVLVIAVQYVTRRRTWSVAFGVVAGLIAYAISNVWPVPFLDPVRLTPPAAQETVHLAIDEATIATHAETHFFPEQQTQWSNVRGRVDVTGVAPGWTAGLHIREATVRLASGVTLRSSSSPSAMLVATVGGDHFRPAEVLRDILGVELRQPMMERRETPPEDQSSRWPVLFRLPQQELAAHVPSAGEYQAHATIFFANFVVEAVLPIAAGAVHQADSYRFVIDRVNRADGYLAVIAREARATSTWQKRPWPMRSFYFRNRSRLEAIAVDDYDTSGMLADFALAMMPGWHVGTPGSRRFVTRNVALSVPGPGMSPGQIPGIDNDWLAAAELVIVRRTDEGAISRELRVSQFALR